jgi:predicted kinase
MKSLSLTQPHAIVMVGIPGSGKTFFAQKFSDTFNAPFVNIDAIVPHSKDSEAAYAIANLQLTELLKTKLSLLIEVDSATRTARRDLAQYLRKNGYVPLYVWVQTDPETARQRLKRLREKDSETFDAQLRRFSPPHTSESPVVISGRHTFATQAKIILKHLSNPRPTNVAVGERKAIPTPKRDIAVR